MCRNRTDVFHAAAHVWKLRSPPSRSPPLDPAVCVRRARRAVDQHVPQSLMGPPSVIMARVFGNRTPHVPVGRQNSIEAPRVIANRRKVTLARGEAFALGQPPFGE